MPDETREVTDFADGIEWFTCTRDGEEEQDCQCARCGSSVYPVNCWQCGGDGYTGHECGEDCCACLDPENNVVCDICHGDGGWWCCASGREWCEANPLPGREHVQSSARSNEDEYDD